ncbi:CHC2 zinc finger domain-containing protein [Brevibacillus sp. AG]|uniref:CHC2 zinc finger domain-containing protein n=1 Tax=Brevibacillus sp. AG TaxID=3020891 RepID=UPI0023315309|nr:CHC2 zinc finger domain-containing protein [Brevibacillus sp. AG]MDC0764259.1 CHC2 zinc finger domain-containing protein [Brevibacillus sp. AG]
MRQRISEETIEFAKSVNVFDIAQAIGLPLEKTGKSYFTNCIVHSEKTPSFSIEPGKNRYHCFGQCHDTGGKGAISFIMYYEWKKYDETLFLQAVEKVCYYMGHPVVYTDGSRIESDRPVKPPSQFRERVDSPLAEPQMITAVYRSLIDKLSLKKEHINHLRFERRMTIDVIGLRQYRSYPERPYVIAGEINQEFTTLEGVPGFYESVRQDGSGTYWNMSGINGILIPVRNEYGIVQGFQLRVESPKLHPIIEAVNDHPLHAEISDTQILTVHYKKKLIYSGKVQDSSKIPITIAGQLVGNVRVKKRNKYIWLSSTEKRKGSKVVPTYHVAYPPNGMPDGSTIDCSVVDITEGPLKGDIMSEYTGRPAVCFPGLSQWYLAVEGAMKLKPKKVILSIDGDAIRTIHNKDTDEEKEEAGEVVRSLIREFAAEGVSIDLALWDITRSSKGIDDLYISGMKPKLFSIIDFSK